MSEQSSKKLKIVMGGNEMSDAMDYVIKGIGSGRSNTAHECIHFKVHGQQATLTAFDGTCSLSSTIDLISSTVDGVFLLPARKMKALIASKPRSSGVSIEKADVNGDKYVMRFGGIKGNFTLCSFDTTMFDSIVLPKNVKVKTVRFDIAALSKAIDNASKSMAKNDSRLMFNGMNFRFTGGKLQLTSTDGHRVSRTKVGYESDVAIEDSSVILPRTAVVEFKELVKGGAGFVEFLLYSAHAVFIYGNRRLTMNLIGGGYADIDRVMPLNNDLKIKVSSALFISALKSSAIVSDEKSKGLNVFIANDGITVAAKNTAKGDEGTSSNFVELSEAPIRSLEFGVKSDYIIDALSMFDSEDVLIHLSDSTTAIMVTSNAKGNEDRLSIVMPLRLAP